MVRLAVPTWPICENTDRAFDAGDHPPGHCLCGGERCLQVEVEDGVVASSLSSASGSGRLVPALQTTCVKGEHPRKRVANGDVGEVASGCRLSGRAGRLRPAMPSISGAVRAASRVSAPASARAAASAGPMPCPAPSPGRSALRP